MRKFVSAVLYEPVFASGALAHGVPDMRLVVRSLDGQTLRDHERSSVRALRRYGLTTSVTGRIRYLSMGRSNSLYRLLNAIPLWNKGSRVLASCRP